MVSEFAFPGINGLRTLDSIDGADVGPCYSELQWTPRYPAVLAAPSQGCLLPVVGVVLLSVQSGKRASLA